jgi:molybdate transport system substrate-binding protein
MKKARLFYTLVVAWVLMLGTGLAIADEIRVAVASNFSDAIKHIAKRFQLSTAHKVTLIFGSTGKHYAQIKNGAPFDVFFAADSVRPQRLEAEGLALTGSRFTYAFGKLVLWSPQSSYVDTEGKVLETGQFRYLSIANPKLAPYGKAAQEVLQTRGVWDALQSRMVRGENIGQTFQFVKTGNAELGFVAYSQLKQRGQSIEGSFWDVPQSLYTPIEQQAVLLQDNAAARSFMSFVKNVESRQVIEAYGYGIP